MSFPPHLTAMRESVPFLGWYPTSRHAQRVGDPRIADLVFGNPHDMPLPAYVAALAHQVVPQNKDWYAYKMSEAVATQTVARTLSTRTGLDFVPEDVFMTNGGFAAIAVSLRVCAGPGDEVIFLSPPWFFYELLIRATGATPVRVSLQPPEFALDAAAIAAAITPRTSAIIVNSPNNPSGRIYGDSELSQLADLLRAASAQHGRPIALLSDEAYYKIAFDGAAVPTPATHYAHTFVMYSYGKQLLAPGQRIGYVALPPTHPAREQLREAVMLAQCATGFAFPNALLQHALPEIEPLCVDLSALARRRDRATSSLRAQGYETTYPASTFYVLVRSPIADDMAFADRLAERDTFVLPGTMVELPGFVRISLTASDAMIEQALKAFEFVRP
jgi:aspartate aminotransferase